MKGKVRMLVLHILHAMTCIVQLFTKILSAASTMDASVGRVLSEKVIFSLHCITHWFIGQDILLTSIDDANKAKSKRI